jgi:surface protein
MGNTLHRQAEEAKKNLIGVQRLVKEVCGNIDASDSSVAKGKARSTTIRFKGKRNKSCFGRFIPALALMCALSLISSAFAATPFPDTSALRTAVTNCLAKVPSGENCCSRLDDPADCGVAGTTDMPGWNTAGVTSMDSVFYNAAAFNQNIGSWDVSVVTNMGYMFRSADAFNQNIGPWNVSAVTTMESMFRYVDAFNYDITGWKLKQGVSTGKLTCSIGRARGTPRTD